MLKAMGYKAGTPDLLIFESRGIYHGLFIELKTEKGRPSPEQKEFLCLLDARGYKTYICKGYEAAIMAIESYLKLA